MTIGNRLRKARLAKGYSQEYVALQLGITQSGYRKIETDETKLRVDALLQLAELLQVDVTRLLYGQPAQKIPAKGAAPVAVPAGSGNHSLPDAFRVERDLLNQLLECKEAHLVVQQKLLNQYEEEINQLRCLVSHLSPTAFKPVPEEQHRNFARR
jgi:transcriptional regulator with XRE-family HTH domain